MAATSECGPLFLGLDLSTQQLKGVLLNQHSSIVYEMGIVFDDEFPEFKTCNGRHVNGDTVTAPVLMWVAAIDLLMSRLKATGLAPYICGISGAAQQHGSVYWRQQGVETNKQLDPRVSLKQQFASAFAVLESPIWEDSSTSEQCRSLEQSAGGACKLARITGSTAFERFTGPQIAKIKETQPRVWSQVSRISLVSSFVASLLIGDIAPIDCSDASGTNLYDIQCGRWSQELCDSIDPQLVQLLGERVVMANEVVGQLSSYYTERYNMRQCPVVAFTGDNPSAFAGFESMFAAGRSAAVVSLGTSDTVLFPLEQYPYSLNTSSVAMQHLDGHVLRHPTDRNLYIAMLCYKNGSLARDWVREHSLGSSSTWAEFSNAADTEPMAPRAFGFYYLSTEILPRAKGIYRFEQHKNGSIVCPNGTRYQPVTVFSTSNQGDSHWSDARAIIESQFMSMCVDYAHKEMGAMTGIAITGGASSNPTLQQAVSDILGVPVFATAIHTTKGVDIRAPAMPAYGGAIRALDQHMKLTATVSKDGSKYTLQHICSPNDRKHAVYVQALADFEFLRNYVSSGVCISGA
ncbi:hypothetical protein LPJ62_000728 [Coemansia sp. RSA 2167]|nr:hypothetical protein LPJ62_000728 [Coemansia sp. RSA 2167]KAJ2154812.1 hypothetical protein J3F82_000881 [Coemansia sp. RSA 637]KAJ2537357.1 hypothetical protein IWW43_000041 [Coemansia sp. RSA 1935]